MESIRHGDGSMALTKKEETRLAGLEKTISKGVAAYIECGEAFKAIRDENLYKSEGTWEQYCKARWNLTKQHVDRVIKASDYAKSLPEPPATERKARELMAPKRNPVGSEISDQNTEMGNLGKPGAEVESEPASTETTENTSETVEEEVTTEDEMEDWNRSLESFCRGLTKYAKDNAPEGPWLDDSRKNIAMDQVKSAASTYRLATGKGLCPLCESGCAKCKQTGFMPRKELELAQ